MSVLGIYIALCLVSFVGGVAFGGIIGYLLGLSNGKVEEE